MVALLSISLPQNMKVRIMDNVILKELLTNCVQIIDLGSKRGAWTGEDLLPVGQVRAGAIQAINDIAEEPQPQTIGDVKDMSIGDAVPE